MLWSFLMILDVAPIFVLVSIVLIWFSFLAGRARRWRQLTGDNIHSHEIILRDGNHGSHPNHFHHCDRCSHDNVLFQHGSCSRSLHAHIDRQRTLPRLESLQLYDLDSPATFAGGILHTRRLHASRRLDMLALFSDRFMRTHLGER